VNDWKWLASIAVSVFFGAVGGGLVWKGGWRVIRLLGTDDYQKSFVTRAEHDAFVRSYEAWKQRVHEDFLEPFRTQTQALYNQGIAIARQGESLAYMAKQMDLMSGHLEELTTEVREARKA
jgi:hypothetical protein